MNTKDLVNELYGVINEESQKDDIVPSYLSPKYDKQGAAMLLGDSPENNKPEILKALCYACITDDEEDVRLAALESLVKLNKYVGLSMAICLQNDEDVDVREEALDIIGRSKEN